MSIAIREVESSDLETFYKHQLVLDAPMSDKQKCPLCDQLNRCAMAEGESISACWCTSIRLTVDMLEAVPAKDRGARCVCATCARALATASPNQALQPAAQTVYTPQDNMTTDHRLRTKRALARRD